MKETSYGIIPLRKIDGKFEAFLVLHQTGFWGFPKGHPNQDEDPKETASRELKEETGLHVHHLYNHPPLTERYEFTRAGVVIEKTAIFYLADTSGEVSLDEKEVASGKWVALGQLESEISYPEGKKLARELIDILQRSIS